MKTYILNKRVLFLLILVTHAIFVSGQKNSTLKAQTDKIIMLDGEVKEGKILAIDENIVRFLHKGETSEYALKKESINEIQFSSGRKEIVNHSTKDLELLYLSTAKDRKGKIAVLPFNYITNDNTIDAEGMTLKLQSNCYNSLKENTIRIQIQDPITTNTMLNKAGITPSKLLSKTPKEIALLLSVEYVVYGVANVSNVGTSTAASDWTTYQEDKVKETGSRPVVVKPEIQYGYVNPYALPQGSYQFSYDSDRDKVTETITNDFGHVKTQTRYENGEIVDARVASIPQYGSYYYSDNNYYTHNGRKSVREKKEEKTKSSGSAFSSNNSTITTDYNTEIDLNFFNDQGINIYSKARTSFGSSIDSYLSTLKYLIKRCPFGTKAGR
ncbi:hypothetical protein GJU43_00900 [Flavobacterium sp. LC2016-23]|uniref:hypothetical protein n=1 Tax=Flavobacterium sp. LC2016-23 TaxID=2666330 RepID=UPI0012B0D945|nr:hypothetical protein [Flavobacterium sp. LC2016-23]MRX37821.1 hypothetical protein [Flavobacterium sp. LC2016-23]